MKKNANKFLLTNQTLSRHNLIIEHKIKKYLNLIIFKDHMNREIILRVRTSQGQQRINVNVRDTFGQLLLQLSKKLNYLIRDIVVLTEDNKRMNIPQSKRLSEIPYFEDGAILKVETTGLKKKQSQTGVAIQEIKNQAVSSKCNHPPGGKCLNCLGTEQKKATDGKEQKTKGRCNHGPLGKCLNCTEVDPKEKTDRLCQHGPNAKCVHCLNKQFISDAAHVSFDHYLQQKRLKCKGVHPSQVKCHNCLPPQQIRYEVDKKCKYHQPYPKAMCNKCIPPSVVIKTQQYRHVDYVQFMNITQIQDFVKYWVQKKHTAQQRVGYLYGYYAEDPNYQGGIRVIVQAIYQPEQKGTYGDVQIIDRMKNTHRADVIANGLGLQRVGWIYTDNNHDTVIDQKKLRMAARLQEEYRVMHSTGYQISNFITVILRTDQKNTGDVKPEVYMISDQGQALQKHDLIVDSSSRKTIKVRVSQNNQQAYPSFIVSGKPATQFETQFLLVKIAHGSSKSNKFAILKKSQFPSFNRDKPSKNDFKQYLKKNKHKPSNIKYGDFNFLLYLSKIMDVETALSIAEVVQSQGKVNQVIQQLIQHKADL